MRNIVIVLLIGIVVGLTAAFFLRSSNKTTQESVSVEKASIQGIVNLNGTVPPNTTIVFSQREINTKTPFKKFALATEITDHMEWNFTDATPGKSYEIQATITEGETLISHSDPIFITAPAQNEILEFQIDSSTSTPNAVISGKVGVNGYIPDGATITVEGRESGKQNFTTVVKDIPAKDEQFMSFASAASGTTYDIRAILLDNTGQQIGASPTYSISPPANNEVLDINSTAKPPVTPTPTLKPQAPTQKPQPQTVSISGVINFNGAALPNSRIVIFQRPTGTNDFKVAVDKINPADGTTWQWPGAVTGTFYDIIAILKQKQDNGTDKDISTSNTLTVSAPAANESFTINSGFTLPAASGNISVSCGNRDGGSNSWGATVSFQTINNAQAYWYQIGTTNGGIELSNFTQNATNNSTQSFNATFKDGTTYFARYAYATTQNPKTASPPFSPFSSTTQLRCSQ